MQHRRQIVDNLEKELWIWRTRCRSDGKNISKRLVQARAKWAFHKHGITDFKVCSLVQITYTSRNANKIVRFMTEYNDFEDVLNVL